MGLISLVGLMPCGATSICHSLGMTCEASDYRIHPILSFFVNPQVEARYRESVPSQKWLILWFAIAGAATFVSHLVNDQYDPTLVNRLLAVRIITMAASVLGIALVLKFPHYRMLDWSGIIYAHIFVINFAVVTYFGADSKGAIHAPITFVLLIFLFLTAYPLPPLAAIVTALNGAVIAILEFVYIRQFQDVQNTFIVLLPVFSIFGVLFLRRAHRNSRLRFKSVEELSSLNQVLQKEVTERKLLEMELLEHKENLEQLVERRSAVLKTREERYRSLVETIPGIILQLNEKGEILDKNEAAMQILGKNKRIIGCNFADTFLPSKEQEMFLTIMKQATPTTPVTCDTQLHTEANGELLYNWHIVQEADSTNAPTYIAIGQDVTMQRRTRQLLVQTEKMMSLGGLAGGLAHELNNPIAGIDQALQLIESRIQDGDRRNEETAVAQGTTMKQISAYLQARGIPEYIMESRKSSERSARIIRNMLEFARSDDTRFIRTSAGKLLERALELAANDFRLKKGYDFRNITIKWERNTDEDAIMGNPASLQQVFLNILTNGAHAMASGTVNDAPPTFHLRISKENSMVKIDIEDNGPGMDAATLVRIFEPFFTTKAAGVGTGLGMSVSYYIIKDGHGGNLTVTSTEGNGACFTITLPAFEEE